MENKIKESIMMHIYGNVPYKHCGRDLKGLDCYGLIMQIYDNFLNIRLWDIDEEYDENWGFKNGNHFLENYYRQWEKVNIPKFYDVVLFKNKKCVTDHGGIIITGQKFIHACKAGIVVTRLNDNKWINRVEGYYRFKGLKNDND